MKRRIALALLVAVAASALLVGAAGAGSASSRSAAAHPIRLTSLAQIEKYLHARHISAAGMVVQTGSRNYAGTSCPGAGWSCTTSTHVIQFARAGSAENRSECSPSYGTPTIAPGFPSAPTGSTQCTIVQVSTTGDNAARCVLQSSMTPDASLYCAIHQESTSGKNDARVDQGIDQDLHQPTGTTENGREEAYVEQYNRSGSNSLQSSQRVAQGESQQSGTPAQEQTSSIELRVNQQSETGRQSARADQTAQLDQKANGQSSGGFQNQHSDVIGHVEQNSQDVSEAAVHQFEDLDQKATKKSGVSQFQQGPMECCASQESNPSDRFNIDQTSLLNASDPFAQQFTSIFGNCSSAGTCMINQLARVNGDSQRNSCSSTGSGCSIETFCSTGQGFGQAPSQGSGTCSAFQGRGGGLRLPRRAG